MTKLTPASAEAGPAVPTAEEQDASLRRLLEGVTGQAPSPQELALVDRLSEAVTERLAAATADEGSTPDRTETPASSAGSASGT
jgi:hypothetical protein